MREIQRNLSVTKAMYSFLFLNAKAVLEQGFQGSGISKDLNSCMVLLLLPSTYCPRQSPVFPMFRYRCEVNFIRILSQTNIEIGGFVAICIILEPMSLHILLVLKWKITKMQLCCLCYVYATVWNSVLAFKCIIMSLIPCLDLFCCSGTLRSHRVNFNEVFV